MAPAELTGYGLILAAFLFSVGLTGVLVRRNIIFVLISLEIMLSAAALAFVSGGARWRQPDGQVMYVFVLALAAVEVAVGLALVLLFYHHHKHLDGDRADTMRG